MKRIHFFDGGKRAIFESNYSSRTHFDLALAFVRHSHGGTGAASAHNPRFAALTAPELIAYG
jgi:hypothetical protein